MLVKKIDKEQRLLDASLELFLDNGFNNVSIDQICKKAQIAKGTFYLYFKDKDDILQGVLNRESKIIIINLFTQTIKQENLNLEKRILYFTNLAIDYFIEHKSLLALFKRNFALPITLNDIHNDDNHEIKEVVDSFINDTELSKKYDTETIYKLIYIVIEMIGSVAYSSICLNTPGPIEEIKPMILEIANTIFNDIK